MARLKEQSNPYADRISMISVNETNVRVDGSDKSFPGPILTELGLRTGPREIAGDELNAISGQIDISVEHVPVLQMVDGLLIWPQSSDAAPAGARARRGVRVEARRPGRTPRGQWPRERRAVFEEVTGSELYQEIPAVAAGRVRVVDSSLWPGLGHLWARAITDDLERLFVA